MSRLKCANSAIKIKIIVLNDLIIFTNYSSKKFVHLFKGEQLLAAALLWMVILPFVGDIKIFMRFRPIVA